MKPLDRETLGTWIVDALNSCGGSATLLEVSKIVWKAHSGQIEQSGDLFYTWQYELRWAAKNLRDGKILKVPDASERGKWTLSEGQ